jgi:glutathione S-transferase
VGCIRIPAVRFLVLVSDIGEKVKLLGLNAKEVALVDQWVHFAEHEIGWPTGNIMHLVFGVAGHFHREVTRRTNAFHISAGNLMCGWQTLDKNVERLGHALVYLESHLATRPSGAYVASDTLSLADLVLAGMVFNARRVSLGTAEIAQYPNVFAHFTKVTEDERVKAFWGEEGWPFVDVAITEPRPFPLLSKFT